MFKQIFKTLILGLTSGAACVAGQKMMNQFIEEQEKKKQQTQLKLEEEKEQEEKPEDKKRK